MTTDKRKATFDDGEKFFSHINTVDDLYTAVIKDIAKSSFEGVSGWAIDQATKFPTDVIHVPFKLTDNQPLPKWLISSFDKTPGVTLGEGISLQEKLLSSTEKTVGNVQYAWDGDDQLAYIDGVASAVFLQ